MPNHLEGVIVPIITALDVRGNFDVESQKRLINYLVNNDVDGIFLLGYTGEVGKITNNKVRQEIIGETSDIVSKIREKKSDFDFVVGVNGGSPHETLDNIHFISSIKTIDGLVLQPSLHETLNIMSLLDEIGSITTKSVYLYANKSTALNKQEVLTPNKVGEISRREQVKGIKVSAPLNEFKEYCRQNYRKGFNVYIGNAIDMFYLFNSDDGLSVTPAGVITGPGNNFPKEWKMGWELIKKGEHKAAQPTKEFLQKFKDVYGKLPSGGGKTIAVIKDLLYYNKIIASPNCLTNRLSFDDVIYLRERYPKLEVERGKLIN